MQQNAQECVWEKTPPLSGKNPNNPRHGGGFDFTRLRSKCGYFQGCMLSTEKAKIFMASLVEAIDTMVSNGGVRMWNGTLSGGRRAFYALMTF